MSRHNIEHTDYNYNDIVHLIEQKENTFILFDFFKHQLVMFINILCFNNGE